MFNQFSTLNNLINTSAQPSLQHTYSKIVSLLRSRCFILSIAATLWWLYKSAKFSFRSWKSVTCQPLEFE